MSKNPAPKLDNPEQSERFLEIAETAEASEDPEVLSRTLKKIAPLPKDACSGDA